MMRGDFKRDHNVKWKASSGSDRTFSPTLKYYQNMLKGDWGWKNRTQTYISMSRSGKDPGPV